MNTLFGNIFTENKKSANDPIVRLQPIAQPLFLYVKQLAQ